MSRPATKAPVITIDPAVARCVTLLRFPLILLVLYIHSFIAPLSYGGTAVAVRPGPALLVLQTAWSNGFARTAIPLFFLISGYLYFLGFDGSLAAWRTKTRRRVSTLLVPYLFWNLSVFALFAIGQALPATAAYFNAGSGRIADLSAFGVADAILGFTHYPAAYPFWFIRDLMLIALLTPIIHPLVTRLGVVVPLVLWAWWAFRLPFLSVPSIEATTYFTIGAWLGAHGRSPFVALRTLVWAAPLYLVLLAADVALRVREPGVSWLYTPAVSVGVVVVLALTNWAERRPRLSAGLIAISGASFFVFAAHEPLMTVLRKLLYRFAPASQAVILTGYALLPLLLAALLVALFFVLRRIAPGFTSLISGGR